MHKIIFVVPFLIAFISTKVFALDCGPLEPKGGADIKSKMKGGIDSKVDGLFKKLVSAGVDIDASYITVQKEVLKYYPESSQLYLWERLIYLNCGVISESSLADEAKINQLNNLVEKLTLGPPKRGANSNAELNIKYRNVLSDIRESLYRKDEFMFPAFHDFINEPNESNWQRVVEVANSNLSHLRSSIQESLGYDANSENIQAILAYVDSTDGYANRNYHRTFRETRKNWNSRAHILEEIVVTKNVPNKTQATEWLYKLENYFLKIQIELQRLIYETAKSA